MLRALDYLLGDPIALAVLIAPLALAALLVAGEAWARRAVLPSRA